MRFISQQASIGILQNIQTSSTSHQPPIQWILEALSPEAKWLGISLTTHLHLVPKFKINGAILPLNLNAFMAWPENSFSFTFLLKGECI